VEERLLLDGIALHAADVAPRHHEPAALVEAHLAHAHRAVGNRALVAAAKAANAAFVDLLDEFRRGFARADGQDVLESRHLIDRTAPVKDLLD
jgi:hypothetical protein